MRLPGDELDIHCRAFIVGCSRSGTTLLQSMLARHGRVYTFPETGVLLKAFGMRSRALPWTRLGLTLKKEWKVVDQLLRQMDREDLATWVAPPRWPVMNASLAGVVAVLDRLAWDADKTMWVEKTPRHHLHADRIRDWIADAHVIHLFRDGREVVASMHHRARRFPGQFARQTSLRYAVDSWNRAMASHYRCLTAPGHTFVCYEALVQQPEHTLKRVCRALGLDYRPALLRPGGEAPFVRQAEAWKADSLGAVHPRASKFQQLFDCCTQRRLERMLDLATYRALVDAQDADAYRFSQTA